MALLLVWPDERTPFKGFADSERLAFDSRGLRRGLEPAGTQGLERTGRMQMLEHKGLNAKAGTQGTHRGLIGWTTLRTNSSLYISIR